MRILAVNGSPRREGKTIALLEHLLRSATSMGGAAELVHLVDLRIDDCHACMGCEENGECVINDDMAPLYESLIEADLLLIGSPVFMGAESGWTKCFLDRLRALMAKDRGSGRPSFITRVPPGKKMIAIFVCRNPYGCELYDDLTLRYERIFKDLLRFREIMAFVVPFNEEDDITDSCYARNLNSVLASFMIGEDLFLESGGDETVAEDAGVRAWGKDVLPPDEDERLFGSEDFRPMLRGPEAYRDLKEDRYPWEDEDDDDFDEDAPLRCPRSQEELYPQEEDDDLFEE